MKRLFALAAMAVLGVALAAPAAVADDGTATTTGTAATPSSAAPGAPEKPVSPYVQPSIVYITVNWTGYVYDTDSGYRDYIRDESGKAHKFQVGFRCTGFVVNPDGWIATAGHCVDPTESGVTDAFRSSAARYAVAHDSDYSSFTPAYVLKYGYTLRIDGIDGDRITKGRPDPLIQTAWSVSAGGVETGQVYPALVKKFQPFNRGDAAILKIDKTDLPAIEIGDSTGLEPQTPIVSVGYPGSVDQVTDPSLAKPVFSPGEINSERTIQGGLLSVYGISATVSGGMSGGPTVDLDGKVIGINSFGINPAIETQPLNFVRPTSNLTDLMSDVGVDNELSDTTTTYYAGLDAYFAGDKQTAVDDLQAVTEEQPTNQMAADYLTKANDLPDPVSASSDDGGFPVLSVAIGVGVLVVLVGVGLLLMTRRRRGGGGGGAVPAYPAGPAPIPASGWAPQTGALAPTATASTGTAAGGVAPVTARAAQPPAAAAPPVEVVGFQAASPGPQAPVEQGADQGSGQAPAMPTPARHPRFCSTCGTRATDAQKFCGNCGTTL